MQRKQTPNLHRSWIDSHAFGIVKALQKKGYTTYLVGGCVRDLLLGNHPKDYDIATMAKPYDVKKIIYNSYVIGKRFRLVLVKRDSQQFEVATFRREMDEKDDVEELPPGDNVFGTPEEDATRRDFTINGMFYDPVNDELLDWTEGLRDLKQGVVRMIGDPLKRLLEDPIRILRAIRLAHMIRFSIDQPLKEAIAEQADSLKVSALPRRREEWLKFLRLQNPSLPFLEAHDLGVLNAIAPHLHNAFEDEENFSIFLNYLHRIKECFPVEPVELFGGFIFAYYRSFINDDPLKPVRTKDILENETLAQIMKDELGMFKYEQSIVAKALHLQHLLSQRSSIEKRGGQRLKALVSNIAFPLALYFAKMDYFLTPEDQMFWYEQLDEVLLKPPTRLKAPNRRRRKTPRK